MTYNVLLLRSMFQEPDETLYGVVEKHLADGQDPNAESSYGETPLMQAFRRGRMDVVALLLDHGADLSHVGWGLLHKAVALGGLDEVQGAAETGDMSARDESGLTPFLLACDIGDIEKAALLLPLSKPEDRFRTYHREPALTVAARKGRAEMAGWLLASGFDANEPDEFGGTALIAAAETGEAEIVKVLLEAGADVAVRFDLSASVRSIDLSELGLDLPPQDFDIKQEIEKHQSFLTAASETENADVARLLIKAGVEPHEFENSVLRELTGAALIKKLPITSDIYEAQKHRIFGMKNPEPVAHEFWLEMIRSGEPAYWGHKKFGKKKRDYNAPAIWSFDRYGMSTTALPDNVWVQIAGEHEDHYDADFCIYNDVIVHDGKGNTQIYAYPREVFPPTDFHTATLIDGAIIIIGSMGYREDRQVGRTQVLRLNLKDYSIDRTETSGELPGWIGQHKARRDGNRIVVWGGDVWDGSNLVSMDGAHELDWTTGVWQRLDRE